MTGANEISEVVENVDVMAEDEADDALLAAFELPAACSEPGPSQYETMDQADDLALAQLDLPLHDVGVLPSSPQFPWDPEGDEFLAGYDVESVLGIESVRRRLFSD